MANSAILNSAGVLQNNGQAFVGANSKIFDAINNAAAMYQHIQDQKNANLQALREKQLQIDAAKQAAMLDPQKVSMIISQKYNADPNSVTPQDVANYNAAQKMLSSKVTLDQYGRPYQTYQPVPLGGGSQAAAMFAPQVQSESLPSQPAQASVGDILLPPVMGNKPQTAEQFQKDIGSLPPPVGQQDKKISMPDVTDSILNAPSSQAKKVETDISVAGDMAKEQYKSSLEDQKKQREIKFNQTKLQSVLGDLLDLNEKLKAGGDVTTRESGVWTAAKNMASGVEVPFTGAKVGRSVERIFDKKAASLRDEFDSKRAQALQLMKNASGMTGGQMNSVPEMENALRMMGSSNGSYEANRSTLNSAAKLYGSGPLFGEKTGGGEAPLEKLTKLPDGFKDIGGGYVQGPDGKKYRIKHD